jgi:hypothetical protein
MHPSSDAFSSRSIETCRTSAKGAAMDSHRSRAIEATAYVGEDRRESDWRQLSARRLRKDGARRPLEMVFR